jgi:hypothetical protein
VERGLLPPTAGNIFVYIRQCVSPTTTDRLSIACTVKKENQIFPVYKEIQNGAVAKLYMTNGLLICGEIFAHFLISRKPFFIYDCATILH